MCPDAAIFAYLCVPSIHSEEEKRGKKRKPKRSHMRIRHDPHKRGRPLLCHVTPAPADAASSQRTTLERVSACLRAKHPATFLFPYSRSVSIWSCVLFSWFLFFGFFFSCFVVGVRATAVVRMQCFQFIPHHVHAGHIRARGMVLDPLVYFSSISPFAPSPAHVLYGGSFCADFGAIWLTFFFSFGLFLFFYFFAALVMGVKNTFGFWRIFIIFSAGDNGTWNRVLHADARWTFVAWLHILFSFSEWGHMETIFLMLFIHFWGGETQILQKVLHLYSIIHFF